MVRIAAIAPFDPVLTLVQDCCLAFKAHPILDVTISKGFAAKELDVNLRRTAIAVLAIGLMPVPGAWAEEIRAGLGFEDAASSRLEFPAPEGSKVGFGVPVAQKQDLAEKPAVAPCDNLGFECCPFTGRYTLREDVGDGVGYTRGFTAFEAMIPIQQTCKSLFFADLRVVNLDHENRWEYNFGGGYRWYSPAFDRVIGVNAFYDMRKTDFHLYQQIGIGLEVLSPCLEFRTNGYFIVGAGHRLIDDTGLVNIGIANNNFIFQRVQTIEVARGGIEVELGGRLPVFHRFAPRAYVSFYSYSAEGVETANGIRGRLETQVTERASLHFSIQHDQVFHTTVAGGVSIAFGAPAYQRRPGVPTWEDVLHQRVHRDIDIVISQTTTTTATSVPVPPPPPPPPPPEPSPEGLRFTID
jgi:hypothetical protein